MPDPIESGEGLAVQPSFLVRSLRFSRRNDKRRVVADLRVDKTPSYPGVDWDHARDVDATVECPTAFVAVIATPNLRQLTVNVRFEGFPPLQEWTIWAKASDAQSVLPRVCPVILSQDLPGCITVEIPFTVDASALTAAGVGRYDIEWEWWAKSLPEFPEEKIGHTRFVVFAIAGAPTTAPWHQPAPASRDRDLPWIEVLDWSCRRAAGSKTRLEAARCITAGVYDLGDAGRPSQGLTQFVYGGAENFLCDSEHHTFRCSEFLRLATGPLRPDPVQVSCEDVATAVCVFANVLGADLQRRRIELEHGELCLRRVKPIGSAPAVPDWVDHEVAWSPTERMVFDGCIQFDMDDSPKTEQWETPAGLRFGAAVKEPRYRGYRHRLLRRLAHRCTFEPLASPTLDRRSVRRIPDGPIDRLRSRYLAKMPVVEAPLVTQPVIFPEFKLNQFIPLAGAFESRGWRGTGTWVGSDAQQHQRLHIVGEWVETHAKARELAAWRLTFYRERLPLLDHGFPGGVVYATKSHQHMVVVYGNLVMRLSSEGAIPAPATKLLTAIANFLVG